MLEFDEFFDYVKDAVEFMFAKRGEHPPLFFVQPNEESRTITLMSAHWNSLADKERMLSMMRLGLDAQAIARCCLVHEMWFATEPTSREPVNIAAVTPPSQRQDREEMVMIIGVDATQSRIGYWKIRRPSKKKKPTLAPFELPPQHMLTALSGAFRVFTKSDGTRQ